MSGSNLLAFALVIALALTAWATVLFVVPSILRSLFRYRMWRFRDHLVDAVFDGVVARSEIQPLIELAEFTIAESRELTLLRLLVFRWVVKPQQHLIRPDPLDASRSTFVATNRDRFGELLAFHLMTGSPSGWIGGCVLLIREAFRTGWGSTRAKGETFRSEVEAELVGEVVAASRATDLFIPKRRRRETLVNV